MISMLLSEAAKSVGSTLSGEDIVFSGCSNDSRTIEKGNLKGMSEHSGWEMRMLWTWTLLRI